MDQQTRTETSPVADALENARNLLTEHPSAAAAQAREIIRVEPGIAEAYVLLSCALRATGNDDEAQETERQAIEVADANPVIARVREQIEAGDLRKADELLHRYLADTPNDPVAVYLRAKVQTHGGEFSEARRLLHRTLSLVPSYKLARAALEALPSPPADASATGSLDRLLDEDTWFTGQAASSSKPPPA